MDPQVLELDAGTAGADSPARILSAWLAPLSASAPPGTGFWMSQLACRATSPARSALHVIRTRSDSLTMDRRDSVEMDRRHWLTMLVHARFERSARHVSIFLGYTVLGSGTDESLGFTRRPAQRAPRVLIV